MGGNNKMSKKAQGIIWILVAIVAIALIGVVSFLAYKSHSNL